MATTYYMKRGDTAPAATDTLVDRFGAPVNLTGATVRFHMTDRFGVTMIDGLATGPNGGPLDTTGQVRYQWQGSDTATAGQFPAEWQVTFSGGAVETWPNNAQAIVVITPDLI